MAAHGGAGRRGISVSDGAIDRPVLVLDAGQIDAVLFGALAERYGDRRAIALGAVTYALGLALSAYAVTPEAHQLLGILIGFGIAGTGFGVILAVVGRAAAPERVKETV